MHTLIPSSILHQQQSLGSHSSPLHAPHFVILMHPALCTNTADTSTKAPGSTPNTSKRVTHSQSHLSCTSELTPTTSDYTPNKKGKLSNPCHHFMLVILIDRKTIVPQHILTHSNQTHNYIPRKPIHTTDHINCNNINHTHKSSSLLYKAQLHAQKGGRDKSITL